MLDLKVFFEGMAKNLLREAHIHAYGKKGLINNSLIEFEVFSFYSDKKRALSLFEKLESWQQRILSFIYYSGSRGLSFKELNLTVPPEKSTELQKLLVQLSRDFLIWRANESGTTIYLGFSDFAHLFKIPVAEVPAVAKTPFDYSNLFDFHICAVLALAQKGELKVNVNGSLHRRSYQVCADFCKKIQKFSDKAVDLELTLIFSFLTSNVWLEQIGANLYPSQKALDFIQKNGFRLHQEILNWWFKARFRGDKEHCFNLLNNLSQGMPVLDAQLLFWVLDPSYRIQYQIKNFTWEHLPRILRELWILGLVNIQFEAEKKQKKIAAIFVSEMGKSLIQNGTPTLPESNISTLPNFDIIASSGNSARLLYMLCILSVPQNDETFLNFRLDKEIYMAGLKANFEEEEILQFIEWLKPPKNVELTLNEWNSKFFGARVRTVELLKIDDLKVLGELAHFPEFRNCTEEYIPGYGFVLHPEYKDRAFEILESFGYKPHVKPQTEEKAPAPVDEWKKSFFIPWHNTKKIDYDLREEVDEKQIQKSLKNTKYGDEYQSLPEFDLVRVLRYSKTTGTLLAAKIKDPAKRKEAPKEIFFFVHALQLAKSPSSIQIENYKTKEKSTIPLSFIQEIKSLNTKELD